MAPSGLAFRMAPPTELRVMLAGLWCMSTAGLQYSFGTYSKEVRDKLGLTQSQLTVLALGKDIGAYLCVYTGVFFDRFGPRSTLLMGVRSAPTHPFVASSRATPGPAHAARLPRPLRTHRAGPGQAPRS